MTAFLKMSKAACDLTPVMSLSGSVALWVLKVTLGMTPVIDLVLTELNSHVTSDLLQVNSPDLLDPSGRKKTQRCKRVARPDKDRAPLKNKRRKKEEDENIHSSTSSSDPLMTHLTQVDQHLPPSSSCLHLRSQHLFSFNSIDVFSSVTRLQRFISLIYD